MRKIVTILAVLLLASPAMAAVSITVAPGAETCTATISYTDDGDPCYVRAFSLDITVSDGNIVAVDAEMAGDCNATDKGYGIFPGSFARVIDAGDPNWEDPGYSPVGYVDDLPGDTQGGIGTSGVTVEMGSLYVDGNAPPSSGVLCTVTVDTACNMTVTVNAGRGGVVLEDASTVTPDLSGATGVAIPCGVECDEMCLRADICSTTYGDPDTLITAEDYVWLSTYYPLLPQTVTDCLGDSMCLRADICSTAYGDPDGLITAEDYVWLSTYYPLLPETVTDCCP
jgi:hypothetical protein